MNVTIDDVLQGQAALVRVYHQSQNYPGNPQVAVIYASGFVRLKQNADPSPAIPFGSSFILGPAYWLDASTYYHNPQLTELNIDTNGLPVGPLYLDAEGTNHDFVVSYHLTLPSPHDDRTRLHVSQSYTATANLSLDPTIRAEAQGFKLVQISSMYINEGDTCDGGFTDCHDSNVAGFFGSDLEWYEVPFTLITPPDFVFSNTFPLGHSWLDAVHTDDRSWQGDTPSVRIALDSLPIDYTVTPQGWITPTTNPNHDNVNLWLHDDGPASQSWTTGQSAQVSYWLIAWDKPPVIYLPIVLKT